METFKRRVNDLISFSTASKSILLLALEIVTGVVLVTLSLATFFKISHEMLDKELQAFDSQIIHLVYQLRAPAVTDLMSNITFLGSSYFLGGAILLTIFLMWRHHRKDAMIFSFILIFGVGLNLLLKDMFARPRPDLIPLVTETGFSFPSGHAMNSFVFYTALSYFVFRNNRNKKLAVILTIIASILIFLIGLSRIYLGVHYPTDVIAGYLAGLFWFVLVLLFEKSIVFFELFHSRKSTYNIE